MDLVDFIKKYNCTMNRIEISKIEDKKIQEIKMKYWNLKHKVFLDEKNTYDKDLEKVYNNLSLEEEKELEDYYLVLESK